MAKFRLNSASLFTFDSNNLTCITSVDLDESVDNYISECMGQTSKEHVLGLNNISGSINFEIADDDVTALGYIDPLTAGALTFYPNGNVSGDLKITSTNMQITGRSMAFSSTGLTTGSASFVLDDLTIAAATGS